MNVSPILLFLGVGLLTYWILPWVAGRVGWMLELRAGHVVGNYRGVAVPLGLGWAWVVWAVGAGWRSIADPGIGALALVVGAAALGWIDDRLGGGGPKGFRGHLGALARGRVTTGLLKSIGVGALALWTAWTLPAAASSQFVRIGTWLMAAAVIALMTNLVNLLDVRPGRALKAYLAVTAASAVALAFAGAAFVPWRLAGAAVAFAVAAGPAAVCLPSDLRERAMLGDMGANAAGAAAGWLLARAVVHSLPLLAVVAAVLLALNLASERVSFSAVIERNRVLRWLDGLGRLRDVGGAEQTVDGETGM